MTEDEAKTKWCPFVNAVVATSRSVNPAGNRTVNAEEGGKVYPVTAHTTCIGSDCMAWRKSPGDAKFRDARTGQLHDRDLTGNGTWVYTGYCGLAGEPR
jgi:hypothetical protein